MAAVVVDTLEAGLRSDSVVAEDAYVVGSSWSADPDYHLCLHLRFEQSHQHPQSQPQLGAAVSIEVFAVDPNEETLAAAIKAGNVGDVNRRILPRPQLSVGWLPLTPNSAELVAVPGDTLPIPEQEYQ